MKIEEYLIWIMVGGLILFLAYFFAALFKVDVERILLGMILMYIIGNSIKEDEKKDVSV